MTGGPALVAGRRSTARPPISYAHLVRLSDGVGLFEHAEMLRPRPEHGYCVDDVARGLVVVAREPKPSAELDRLAGLYLGFVLDSLEPDGRVHNRRVLRGGWSDEATVEDCWGRALWGLGTAAARIPALADAAYRGFDIAVAQRSPDLRSMAFAAMGAAEVLTVAPRHAGARAILRDAADLLDTRAMRSRSGRPDAVGTEAEVAWPWPEPRLRYANAVLPETLVAAGELLGHEGWLRRGLAQLSWLVDVETGGRPGSRHLSVTPSAGWTLGEERPGYDQQPIEVAALADACARAAALPAVPSGATSRDWAAEVLRCEAWFQGANDARIPMADAVSGGGYDGLMRGGRNLNEGAESTLALISTLQQADRVRSAA